MQLVLGMRRAFGMCTCSVSVPSFFELQHVDFPLENSLPSGMHIIEAVSQTPCASWPRGGRVAKAGLCGPLFKDSEPWGPWLENGCSWFLTVIAWGANCPLVPRVLVPVASNIDLVLLQILEAILYIWRMFLFCFAEVRKDNLCCLSPTNIN